MTDAVKEGRVFATAVVEDAGTSKPDEAFEGRKSMFFMSSYLKCKDAAGLSSHFSKIDSISEFLRIGIFQTVFFSELRGCYRTAVSLMLKK